MTYKKPKMVALGKASDAIQSILTKGPYHFDQMQGPPILTSVSAYQADE